MTTIEQYNHKETEPRWQKAWKDNNVFAATDCDTSRTPMYVLDMFPYPSGSGLHVGHPEGYTATDIYCRYLRMAGYNVLHPMGWDAFGLPAEQYAIETGTHPRAATERNIARFREQIESLGFSYDWDRELSTTDPAYFKWTQWIFLKLFKRGLAYQADIAVNWCPALKTVLANEEVIDGLSERGGHPVIRKPMSQWVLKITAYAERLLNDLELVDWPEPIKLMQRNWIGRSEGAHVEFLTESGEAIRIYTTRPDTLFGATYMVLAPEHSLVDTLTTPEHSSAVLAYREAAAKKSDLERTELSKEKTGVFTGAYAINPVNNEKIPIWVSDYVLISYGTGAIMCVPGHDRRDWEFATKFNLPIVEVISGGDITEAAYEGDGTVVNSGFISGLHVSEAKLKITEWLEEKEIGEAAINYKLRDWVFSRQRYWGEPIPVIHCPKCGVVPVPESDLPVTLPEVESYQPTGTGESPLAAIEEWCTVACPDCGTISRRETHTMPQWAGSSWYFLRYIDPHNDTALVDPEKEKYWMPVNMYVGGAEHAVLHLLYARFWHKVLYDEGIVSTCEPFHSLRNQGMILGEDGEKMSKSRGNVINPDDVVEIYGADTLRMYEMFMGPLEQQKPWQMQGVEGIYRFVRKVWRLAHKELSDTQDETLLRLRHKTIKKVTEDIISFRFNTAISSMMIFVNEAQTTSITRDDMQAFISCLSPFAPHISEEIWQKSGFDGFACNAEWPAFDDALTVDDTFELVVQINGKLRTRCEMARNTDKETALAAAKSDDAIAKWLDGKTIVKEIFVPNKLVNIVIK